MCLDENKSIWIDEKEKKLVAVNSKKIKCAVFKIEEGLEIIGQGAIVRCPSLRTIIIPTGMKKIDSRAFAFCKNLKLIVLPESLKKIHSEAFKGCDKLTRIIIDSDNDIERQRIKNLLPENLRDKVYTQSCYKQITDIQMDLLGLFSAKTAKITENSLNELVIHHPSIYADVLQVVGSFLKWETPDYKRIKQEIESLDWPKDESKSELRKYRGRVAKIVNESIKRITKDTNNEPASSLNAKEENRGENQATNKSAYQSSFFTKQQNKSQSGSDEKSHKRHQF